MAGHDIVSAKTGQVFGDNHVDLLSFDICNHSLEIRAVKAGAAESVIDINIVYG